MKPGLDAIRAVCAALGDPQRSLRAIHVAGTNGKGAVCALIDASLRAAGLKVGRYTSPHLVRLNERFFLDGTPIGDDALRLARDFENIVAIKEASGNITQMDDIIKNKPQDFDVISGDDGITFPLITLGAVGVISVIGNALPHEFSRMVRLALKGEYASALTIHHKFAELFKLLFVDGNPAGVKAMLSEMGMIENQLRLPLVPTRLTTMREISAIVRELGY